MGYINTLIFIYGVEITKQQYEILNKENFTAPLFYRLLTDYDIAKGKEQLYPITPYEQHSKGNQNNKIFDLKIVVENSDSRTGDEDAIREDNKIYFGRVVAINGYAYQDDINYFINNPPQEVLNDKLLLDILQIQGINKKPQIIVTQQVW